MSALFNVTVLQIDSAKAKVDLQLTIINPDQKSFYNTKSFALMLLLDPLRNEDTPQTTLLNEIPIQDILDFNLDIVRKKENKVVKKVELHSIQNFPIDKKVNNYSDSELRKFWSKKEHLPHAILSVTTKDKGFVEHLKEGEQWESGAFNVI